MNGAFSNLDLISIGGTIAGIGVLGFMVYFSDRKSTTNRAFLSLAIAIIFWSAANYLSYQFNNPLVSFWILRFVIFFAVWFAYFLFRLFYVFPLESISIPRPYGLLLMIVVVSTALLTLSPFVFYQVAQMAPTGAILQIRNDFGIYIFGIVVVCLDLLGIAWLVKKTIHSKGIQKRQFLTVLIGVALTIFLILIFNFIFPAFLNDPRFIPLSGVFVLPFIAFTAYAIFRHHLLNVKVIATEILALLLAIATLFEVFLAASLTERLLRGGVFLLVLGIGILLIKSVLREVEQREELERLDKILEDKNRQLEDLSHFKSQLLSLASHQIRSPLAAIKGFVQLIVSGSYGPVEERAKEALVKVQHSADELIGLIDTLLDMRKVDEGKMDYQFARTDLAKLAADVFDLLKPLADAKKLEFTLVVPGGTPPPSGRLSPGHEVWVNADGEKLKQVVQNLADNAIKYTPSGFVKLELAEKDGAATVTVSDSGVGIPADLVPHLFEEFVRDERVKKKILGTGLGLYVARKIAEAHGGKIWAESAGEGKGSAFHMSVPVIK